MNRRISFRAAAAIASVSVFASISPVFAQDEAADDDNKQTEAAKPAEAVESGAAKEGKNFYPLLQCVRAVGSVQVCRPNDGGVWKDAKEGRYYPFGSTVRVTGARQQQTLAEFAFGDKSTVKVTDDAEFATRPIEIGEPTRVLVLKSGRLSLSLPRSLKDGLFSVQAPFAPQDAGFKVVTNIFECVNLAGDSIFEFKGSGDGYEALVRCVTGTMALNGHHYGIPRMQAANQIRLRSTTDNLFTSLRGESGSPKVILDQGMQYEDSLETGKREEVKIKPLEFELSPKCAVKIFRAKAEIGGRVSVSTMTLGTSGEIMNHFTFAEGRASINIKDVGGAKDAAAASKKDEDKADDNDDEETVEEKKDDAGDEEKKDESEEKKDESEEKKDDDAGL